MDEDISPAEYLFISKLYCQDLLRPVEFKKPNYYYIINHISVAYIVNTKITRQKYLFH